MTRNTSLVPLGVLVVDDEALIRWSVGEALALNGHRVVEAGSARAALDAIAKNPDSIDVVLLDFQLPDSNDLGLLARIRQLVPESAVVLMTAHPSSEIATAALALGAYQMISKPFDIHDLDSLVRGAYAAAHR